MPAAKKKQAFGFSCCARWLPQKCFFAVRRRVAVHLIVGKPNVGAGLPAKAVDQVRIH